MRYGYTVVISEYGLKACVEGTGVFLACAGDLTKREAKRQAGRWNLAHARYMKQNPPSAPDADVRAVLSEISESRTPVPGGAEIVARIRAMQDLIVVGPQLSDVVSW